MKLDALYKIYTQYPEIETDTRKLKPGALFVALKGPNFNGNAYAADALAAGAPFALIDDPAYATSERMLLVDDALDTLQQLALYHRRKFSIPFIAITGSNGKTTTKELVSAVLGARYKTYTTRGNLNNHIGIPLTILGIRKDAEMAVIEMGANHQQEIAAYCRFTEPTHGIITNCGKAHLEGFGGEAGVRKGKGELFDHLRAHQGTAFVMWDYDYLRTMSAGIPHLITYGTHEAAVSGTIIRNSPFLCVQLNAGITINSQIVGEYNLPNILAAATVGHHFHVPWDSIKTTIENYVPSNSRSQLVEKAGNRYILDAYNANPTSMRAAIENFAALPYPNKVLMLGAMAELGTASEKEHRDIIELIGQHSWKEVVLVGADFQKLSHPFLQFENAARAAEWFQKQPFQNCSFLIKGSRSMQMEKIVS